MLNSELMGQIKNLRRHRTVYIGFYVLIISACWIYLYDPWLADRDVIPYDAIDEFYPSIFFVAQSLRHGEFPWWNPYLFMGFPQIGDPQAMIFSPLVTISMAAVANPTPHWLDLIVLFHILLGGIGMFGFLRLAELSVPSAIFGAVIAMGGSCLPARLEHTALVISTCTLPWVAWALLALCQKPNIRRGCVLGIAMGWMGLHLVQTTFIALLIITFAVITDIAFSRDRFRRMQQLAPPLLMTALITVALCGTQVLALLTFLPETVRDHLPLSASSENSAPWPVLLTFLWPSAMHTFAPNYHGSIDITESIIYSGYPAVAGLLLGLAAIQWAAWMPNRQDSQHNIAPGIFRLSAALLAFCLAYALGTHTPFYGLLYHIVPGVSLLRRPVDAMFLVTLCLSPVAALGLERLLCWLRHLRLPRVLLLASAGLPIVLLCWDLESHTLTPNQTNSWTASFVEKLPNRFTMVGLLRLGVSDAGQPDWRVEFNQPAPLWPDLPAIAKIYSSQGYNPFIEARYKDVFGTTPNGYAPVAFTTWMPGYTSPLFGLLGVKYIVSASGSAADSLASTAGLTLAFHADGMNAWATSNHLPRLFSPSKAIAATTESAPKETADVKNLATTMVIEGRPAIVADCATTPLQSISLVKYRLNNVYIRTASDAASGWLVMTDPDTLGWHAYVDGQETRLFRADGYLRAICVPGGIHTVLFRFEPFRQMAATLAKYFP